DSSAPTFINPGVITVTAQFSTPIPGLKKTDVSFPTTLTVGDFQTTDSQTYTFTVARANASVNTIQFNFPAGLQVNGQGINNLESASLVRNLVDAPVVAKVTTTAANGTYRPGDVIPIQVHFSKPVKVDTTRGTPRLTLSTGGGLNNAVVEYV